MNSDSDSTTLFDMELDLHSVDCGLCIVSCTRSPYTWYCTVLYFTGRLKNMNSDSDSTTLFDMELDLHSVDCGLCIVPCTRSPYTWYCTLLSTLLDDRKTWIRTPTQRRHSTWNRICTLWIVDCVLGVRPRQGKEISL
jgi:hypothetical protein